VARVTTEFSRNLLRGLVWDAQDQGLRLEAAIKAACRGKYHETNTGLSIVGASGNGSSVTFALPQAASSFTPDALAVAFTELYDLYESAVAEFVAEGNATPNDAQVIARMLALLKPKRERSSDFSQLCTA
jgi:hypothetical protein